MCHTYTSTCISLLVYEILEYMHRQYTYTEGVLHTHTHTPEEQQNQRFGFKDHFKLHQF